MISLDDFLSLSKPEIAKLVRESGSQVCVFPINGTRRWFALEHEHKSFDDPIEAYMDISGQAHLDVYRLIFNYGIDTLLTPIFGAELFRRGDEYMQKIGADGLARLATHPDFLNFYNEYDVRVRFYGDYRNELKDTPYAHLPDLFDQATEQTSLHTSHRLFFGVFATDATEMVAEFGVRYHSENGKIPDRGTIISMYYGEHVESASLYISSDKFWVFDYPLLSSGEEDLYFMAAPCLYLSDHQLRHILYDHLYTRSIDHPDYAEMSKEGFLAMKKFYTDNREITLGVGKMLDNVWLPLHLDKAG